MSASREANKEHNPREWHGWVAGALFLLASFLPLVIRMADRDVALYYGALYFAVLLGVSLCLVSRVESGSSRGDKQKDYRVVHFTLCLALTFGIAAAVLGILLVGTLLRLLPVLRP